jgi:magnesium transporter
MRSLAAVRRSLYILSTCALSRRWRAVVSPHTCQGYARLIAWSPHTNPRPAESRGMSDEQEDAAKAAILEKVMKGRQPTDLMLRCE